MSQNVSLWGATYSNVPAIDVPKSGGGTATFTDVTDTTATASDVASGKYFYTAAGVKTQGTSTSGGYITQDADGYVVLSPTNGVPTLINKTITESGTYSASADGATGYSNVTVTVGGTNIERVSVGSSYYGISCYIEHEPKAFAIKYVTSVNPSSTYEYIIDVVFDGTTTECTVLGSNGRISHSTTSARWTYDGAEGLFNVDALNYTRFTGGQGTYEMIYVY